MTIQITASNWLRKSESYTGEVEKSQNIYREISRILGKDSHTLLIIYNNQILERNLAFQGMQTTTNWNLYFIDGKSLLNQSSEKESVVQQSLDFPQQIQASQFKNSAKSSSSLINSTNSIDKFEQTIQFKRQQLYDEINKLDELSTRNLRLNLNLSSSISMTQNMTCSFCNFILSQDCFQTPCGHNFHSECIKMLLKTQTDQGQVQFSCFCKSKLSIKVLPQIFENRFEVDILILQVLMNQQNIIKKNYNQEILHCKNNCSYFCLKQGSQDLSNCNNIYFCPLCCLHTQFIKM